MEVSKENFYGNIIYNNASISMCYLHFYMKYFDEDWKYKMKQRNLNILNLYKGTQSWQQSRIPF